MEKYLLLSLLLSACASKPREIIDIDDAKPVVQHNHSSSLQANEGLKIETLKKSNGKAIQKGQLAKVHYTGWLINGKKFDSSVGKKPFSFRVGDGDVIRGWDLGVEGMKVGEKRKLTIPPELGYGPMGAGNVIPPDSTLLFEVELLAIAK